MKKQIQKETRDRIAIITDVLRNHKGRMLTFTFTKKDGSIRKLNGRFGVYKGVNGNGMSYNPAEKGLLPIYEIKAVRNDKGVITGNIEQWRMVNLSTVISVRMNHKELIAL